MPVVTIESFDDPRLDPYRDLKSTNCTRWSGEFVAEGKWVVRRLLTSNVPVVSVLATDRRLAEIRDFLRDDVDTLVVPQAWGTGLVGYNFHTGILAVGKRMALPALAEVAAQSAPGGLWIACCRIVSPENLGNILRLSAAFGVEAVVLGPGCADPFSRRVLRVSMGAVLALSLCEVPSLPCALWELQHSLGFEAVASVVDAAAPSIAQFRPRQRLVLVLGNEAEGIDGDTLAACSRRVTIPITSRVDSLNVATAAGILLYQLRLALKSD